MRLLPEFHLNVNGHFVEEASWFFDQPKLAKSSFQGFLSM